MLFSENIKKILLPRVDTIGDIVLLEPFLRALKDVFKSAQMTLLVREKYEQLAYLLPNPLRWQVTGINPFTRPPVPSVVRDLLSQLENEHWDMILFTKYEHTWLEYLIAARFKNLRRIVISPMEKFPEWLRPYLHSLGVDSEFSPCELVAVEEKIPESDKYQVLIDYLAGETKKLLPPKLTVPDSSKEEGIKILESLGLGEKKFCVCLTGGIENIAIKRWPSEKFAKVIAWLKRKHKIDTLLIGHAKEREIVEEVAGLARTRSNQPPIWIGKDGEIPLLAGILEQAKFYLGNDTGPMHMSAALGIPVVALFGGGTWPRFIPKGSESHVVVRPMPCFYCGWKCSFRDAPCIRDLPISLVQKALERIMEKDRPDKDQVFILEAEPYPGITKIFIEKAGVTFRESEADREARLHVIYGCWWQIQEISEDREARLKEIEDLGRRLQESESDRAARLEVIRNSERKIQEIEGDREARLKEIEDLGRRLEQSEADRVAQLEAIHRFEKEIEEINQDRDARLRVIEDLGKRLQESEAERVAVIKGAEVLERRLQESEADWAARLEVIREQTKLIEVQRAELIKSSLMWKMAGPFNRLLKK